jgi:hypothetical protein
MRIGRVDLKIENFGSLSDSLGRVVVRITLRDWDTNEEHSVEEMLPDDHLVSFFDRIMDDLKYKMKTYLLEKEKKQKESEEEEEKK